MYVFGSGPCGWRVDERIGFGLYQSCVDMCPCFGCGGVGGEWVSGLDQGRERWCYVCVSLDSLCRWQVQVSVYCAWWIPAHLRCIQCSILLHLMDICFLTCICLCHGRHHKSRLVCLKLLDVTWIGLDITRFCEQQRQPSSIPKQTVNRDPITGVGKVGHKLHSSLSPLRQLHRLEPPLISSFRTFPTFQSHLPIPFCHTSKSLLKL